MRLGPAILIPPNTGMTETGTIDAVVTLFLIRGT
jgi:hypothetical protein